LKKEEIIPKLKALFTDWSGEIPKTIKSLPASGSSRQYFRLSAGSFSAIGVWHPDKNENRAFIAFTAHFLNKGLHVPQIFAKDMDNDIYLLQDLGNTTLFSLVNKDKADMCALECYYKKVLDHLLIFQFKGGTDLDYSFAYPREIFDEKSMMWDLNYFKYHFLKLAGIPFNEARLEQDFEALTKCLLQAEPDYFMYRDFQSRNIMFFNNDFYFIDYQGGRKGPLHYDLASLLFEGKVNLPMGFRESMLHYYMQKLHDYIDYDEEAFVSIYYPYVLIRLLQAFGAYGYRGLFERKALFVQSIPFGIRNLEYVLNEKTELDIPEIRKCLEFMKAKFLPKEKQQTGKLTVRINSFSYRRGIPADGSGNGGGYVFDCRNIPNPGRFETFRQFTGKDQQVKDFFKGKNQAANFENHVKGLIEQTIAEYQKHGYTNLMISFGCTGGQHRSVYMAEKMAVYVRQEFDVEVILAHHEENNWPASNTKIL
jgi:aminoglycoside/choline kinase family phosphotransferase